MYCIIACNLYQFVCKFGVRYAFHMNYFLVMYIFHLLTKLCPNVNYPICDIGHSRNDLRHLAVIMHPMIHLNILSQFHVGAVCCG